MLELSSISQMSRHLPFSKLDIICFHHQNHHWTPYHSRDTAAFADLNPIDHANGLKCLRPEYASIRLQISVMGLLDNFLLSEKT